MQGERGTLQAAVVAADIQPDRKPEAESSTREAAVLYILLVGEHQQDLKWYNEQQLLNGLPPCACATIGTRDDSSWP